jgi:EAL domain-containing protein (putative c-di-GMP-specific phosphodiesterase class I)
MTTLPNQPRQPELEHRLPDDEARATRFALNWISSDVSIQPTADVDVLRPLVDDVLTLGHVIRSAIARGAFSLMFQPVVDLADRSITHHEAMIRFDDGESPARAVLLAEELGFCTALDHAVVERAVNLLEKVPPSLPALAVNLSGYSVADTVFMDGLVALLAGSRVAPARLMFEVGEPAATRSSLRIDFGIARLRRLGFAVGLDNFGTGGAPHDRLRQLDVDFVKIDRALTLRLDGDPYDDASLGEICRACAEIGIRVIGNGVESDRQAATLRALGAHGAQGWWFGRPTAQPRMTTGAVTSRPIAFEERAGMTVPAVPAAR